MKTFSPVFPYNCTGVILRSARALNMVQHRMTCFNVVVFILIINIHFARCRQQITVQNLTLQSDPLFVDDTLVSDNGYFEAGIFTFDKCSGNYYLAIRYRSPIVAEVTWVANRDAPVSQNAYWMLSNSEGLLQLFDESIGQPNEAFWSSTTSMTGNVVLSLEDQGNLVVKNGSETWDSFTDAPLTDTFLPGQEFQPNMTLTSWKDSTDPASGYYNFGWTTNGILQLAWTAPIPSYGWTGGAYLPLPKNDTSNGDNLTAAFSNIISLSFQNSTGALYENVTGANALDIFLDNGNKNDSASGGTQLQRIQLGVDGGLWLWTWNIDESKEWSAGGNLVVYKRNYKTVDARCCTFGECGEYGICSSSNLDISSSVSCMCPAPFSAIDVNDPKKGCFPTIPVHGPECTNATFYQLDDTDFPWAGDLGTKWNSTKKDDGTDCKQQCQDIHDCAAVVYTPDENGVAKCWLKAGPLYNGGWPTSVLHGTSRMAFLKISCKWKIAESKNHSSHQLALPLALGIGIPFILIAGLLSIIFFKWIMSTTLGDGTSDKFSDSESPNPSDSENRAIY